MYSVMVGKNTDKPKSSLSSINEPAIFMDADGTLWADNGPGSIFQEINLSRLSSKLLSLCDSLSIYRVFIVTNQTCVARGLFSLGDLEARIAEIEEFVRESGVDLRFRFCIHHPEASEIDFRIDCLCRKPAPGLIQEISKDFSIDLESSLFIGDRITDAQAANYAGIKHVFLIANEKMFELNVFSNIQKYDNSTVAFRVVPTIALLAIYFRKYGVQFL